MRILWVILFIFCACKGKQKEAPVVSDYERTAINIDSSLSRLSAAQTRFEMVLSVRFKRDSFLTKKYENEILYYQTQNDKYRRRANRFVDSVNKYVLIIDSLDKQMKH